MTLKLGVPKETAAGERRVALVPDVVKRLTTKGVQVTVEPGAGEHALIPDGLYADAGATLGTDGWTADVVLKVAPPPTDEVARSGGGSVLIGFLAPLSGPDTAKALRDKGTTAFAMEAIPRIS